MKLEGENARFISTMNELARACDPGYSSYFGMRARVHVIPRRINIISAQTSRRHTTRSALHEDRRNKRHVCDPSERRHFEMTFLRGTHHGTCYRCRLRGERKPRQSAEPEDRNVFASSTLESLERQAGRWSVHINRAT